MTSFDKKENPFYNILFNIVLPVIILNKFSEFFPYEHSSTYSLLLALSFPVVYGLKDYYVKKKTNFISVIGVLSIALTGGLALMQLEGIYFAIKEAAVPLFIALILVFSIFYKKPFIKLFLFEMPMFQKDLITKKIEEHGQQKQFEQLMNKSTWYLAGTFVLSAILNFIIALLVFKKIDASLEEALQKQILNKQIADMTWMGYVFIAFPISFITLFLLAYISRDIKKMTGLGFLDILQK